MRSACFACMSVRHCFMDDTYTAAHLTFVVFLAFAVSQFEEKNT